jgi:hypothetical protein
MALHHRFTPPLPRRARAGGNGALGAATDAREQLTAAAADCAPGQALAPGIDYLVGCDYNAAADQLWVLAGNSGGAVGFFPVVEPPQTVVVEMGEDWNEAQQQAALAQQAQQQQAQRSMFGRPQAVLAGGAHSDVVRSVLWPGATASMCLSGSEDSKICVWSLQQQAAAAGAQQQHQGWPSGSGSAGSSREGAVRKHAPQQQHHQPRRAAPY